VTADVWAVETMIGMQRIPARRRRENDLAFASRLQKRDYLGYGIQFLLVQRARLKSLLKNASIEAMSLPA
jgi:hypothetical protein